MLLMLIVAAALQSTPARDKPLTPDDAAKVAGASAADPAKDFICKTEEVTGTRFTKKVCRRKEEFAEKAREEQQRLRTMQRPQYSCVLSKVAC